jgi:hypothetical protein
MSQVGMVFGSGAAPYVKTNENWGLRGWEMSYLEGEPHLASLEFFHFCLLEDLVSGGIIGLPDVNDFPCDV